MPATESRRLGVVVNPTAGKGRGARLGQLVIERFRASGHDVRNLSATSSDLALEHARRGVISGMDALIVVGGDGMVHLGIQAVADTPIPCGVVAVGTGNDFAAVLGLPVNQLDRSIATIEAALAAGPQGIQPTDALRVSGAGLRAPRPGAQRIADNVRWVAGAVSAGLDAAVNARANAMLRPKGSARYLVAALRELAGYRAWPYRLTLERVQGDEAELTHLMAFPGMQDLGAETSGGGRRLVWTHTGAIVTAANSPQIGGGMKFVPTGSVTDGVMDVVVAADLGKAGAGKLLTQILTNGQHVHSPHLRIYRAGAVTIEPGVGAGHIPAAYADGEFLGTLPVRVEIVPGALQILAPSLVPGSASPLGVGVAPG